VPSAAKIDAYSTPITPAPTTVIVRGTQDSSGAMAAGGQLTGVIRSKPISDAYSGMKDAPRPKYEFEGQIKPAPGYGRSSDPTWLGAGARP